jgi:hypothetical protein
VGLRVVAAWVTCGAAVLAVAVAVPALLTAQRRPGVGTGFYTTTGLLTGDLEVGSVSSSTSFAEAPTVAMSALLTAPLRRAPRRAWIVSLRATPLGVGNGDSCVVALGVDGCLNRRFEERAALLSGGAFDIRSTVLRGMVGPALYSAEGQGARIGTVLRIDYAAPRLRGPTPTLFFTRTFLGSQRGESVGISTLGAGLRWVRKR